MMAIALKSALPSLLAATALAMLSACATPPQAELSLASGQTTENVVDESEETITGSRLRRKTTDRMVRATNAAGAKEMERARPPSPGPAFN